MGPMQTMKYGTADWLQFKLQALYLKSPVSPTKHVFCAVCSTEKVTREVFFGSQVIICHMFIQERHGTKNTRVTVPHISETMFYKQNHKFYVGRTVHFGMKFKMTNVMHKFLTYLSIYFCLICFRLPLTHLLRQVHNFGSGSSLLGKESAPGHWHHTEFPSHKLNTLSA
jgi:hypothetical protein